MGAHKIKALDSTLSLGCTTAVADCGMGKAPWGQAINVCQWYELFV